MEKLINSIVAVVLICMAVWVLMPASDAADTPYCDRRDVQNVVMMGTRTFIQKHLKSPYTARFGHVKPVQVSKCVFRTQSYVDSQNGFGAMVRLGFDVTFEIDPENDSVNLINLEWIR